MNRRNQIIGRGGDNRIAAQLVALRIAPDIVEAGKGEQIPLLEPNAEGLLALACPLPFIESARRRQAAPALEWPAKYRALRNRLGARVNGRELRAWLLRPRWDQPPLHFNQAIGAVAYHDRHCLARG